MRKTMLCLGLTLVLALAFASAAWAQAAAIRPLTEPIGTLGPINTYVPGSNGTPATGNGFPLWVGDRNGVKVDLQKQFLGDGVTPPTMIFDPPIANNQFSQDIGFGAEAFPYLATSRIDLGGGNRAELTLGVEAAFGAEAPLNGDQFLFVRVRIRIDTTVAGDYTVITPWGTYSFPNTPAGRRAINFTYDFGGFGPVCPDEPSCFALGVSESPGFERILVAPTEWSFLVQQNPPPPAGWIGDGVNVATVSAGPTGIDYFRIVGPGETVQTNLFTVSGHIYQGGTP
ncbi:MAG: hypothetical protein FJ128_13445 [Deltaproteobacteria bacterium]|nr:hypothetical protein [Deltaproteobacteria bacterium]